MAAILGYSSAKEMLDTIHDIQDQLYLDPKERSDILKVLYHYGQIQSRESRMRRKGRQDDMGVHLRPAHSG